MKETDVELSSYPVDDKASASVDDGTASEPAQEQPKARPQRLASFKDYLRVFQYATKWDFFAYAAGILASIGAGITLPLMNVVFGMSLMICFFLHPFLSSHVAVFLYMFALFLGRLGLNYINKFAFRMIGIRISSAIRLHYLTALLGQSIHVLDSMPPGYATTTITSTSNVLQLGISEKLGVFFEYNATIVASIIIAFTRNWALTLVTSSTILFIGLSVSVLMPLIVKGHGRVSQAEAKSSAVASETFASIRMISACGAESRMAKKYGISVEEAKMHAQHTSPFLSLQFGLIFFSVFSAFALAFWYGTKEIAEGHANNVGTIVIVLMSVMNVVFSLERTTTPMLAVSKATVAACQFFTVIDAPQPEKGHLTDPEVSATDDIVFDKVTFAYPSRPHVKILDELDLRIEAGKINAIVGPSGSGKSTVVGLIERWYTLKHQYVIEEAVEPEKKKKKKKKAGEAEEELEAPKVEDTGPPVKLSGTLTTCGHALDDIHLKWWRSQIGLVQQEPFLFNDSIYKNVANGLIGTEWENEPEEVKRKLVKEACIEAFVDEFVDKLPQGYDTLVGDSGAKLSGGQRQRIAIARSIVRKPKILILDEATSAIDVRGERIVQAALDRVAQNRTTITIAHRLSTIKKADRIIVIKKGKVAEQGNHESLIALEGGVYAGLVQAQALSLGNASQAEESDDPTDSDDNLTREKSQALYEATAQTDSSSTEKERNIFSSFGRLFYETNTYWYLMFITLIFTACAGAATPLQAWLFAKLIVVFEFTGQKLLHESRFWSLMWFVLAIGVGISYFGAFLASTRMASIIRAKYQQQYFEAILYQKTSYFDHEDHSHGTMTARAAGDPQRLEELMGANMASVYIALFNLTGSIIISFYFGWKLALVGVAVVMPILLASSYWRFRYELQFEKMNNEVFAESSKFASESIGAFRTVTSLTLETPITDRFKTLCDGHVKTAFKKARFASFLFGFADSCTLACQALIFYYGSRLLASGEYKPENYFVCFMAIMNASQSAGQSFGFGPNAAQVTEASNRILNTRETMFRDKSSGGGNEIPDVEGGVKIELKDVHFKYPTRDMAVFRGLNLTIEKGQFAALVGSSGCGKTSIISLLERRFYDLDKGRILCNGQDIADVNVFDYRKYLSLVAQEPTLFQGTLRDNIILGVDDATTTDEQIHQACRDASIHDFIVSLPEGYNTNIGSRGVSLSGGQKQRVAIARALIRKPNILLLDEATSSLDSESEKLVQAAFERASKGRTMVVVAHRLATVQNADVIFVLGEGQLLEQGSHMELLKKKGVYWNMCQSQALDR
ncbi:multidrug resistance-type transporter protein [Trichoderma atroviride IMI 206040]|uniref:Multidrug resistance-type transporter protein n=1 Tax=Hypocrea atroviridis (strain ATCC 20476 / IMI 206040) TaxID=452589 RepID=G9P7K0_HYPAI|nr:multidrug resistance-type transporter protein [Trichoderma atroviride IMI 206040]EHK40810.1 multidrug resistance-type transporter protein [Trichoderma atroviride IMI 206040]